MKFSFPKHKIFKRAILTLIILGVLVLVGYGVLRHLLHQNGISAKHFSFTFPSTLVVDELKVESTTINLEAKVLKVHWNWSAVLHGNWTGEYIFISSATIYQIPDTTTSSSGKLPNIAFKEISINNSRYYYVDNPDSISVEIPSLRLVDLSVGEEISVDSLFNTGCALRIKYSATEDEPDTSNFSIDDLPSISIGYLDFTKSEIELQNPGQRHAVTDLNLNLHGLKSDHLLDVSINQLAFVYQDTLEFAITLDEAKMNRQEEIRLADLSLSMPGVRLNTPEVTIKMDSTFQIDATFIESYVNTQLVMPFLIDDLFKTDFLFRFKGGISYSNNTLYFDDFAAQLPAHTSLVIDGLVDLPDKQDRVELKVKSLKTSLSDLTMLFATGKRSTGTNININTSLLVGGTYELLTIGGPATINNNTILTNFTMDLRDTSSTDFSLSLQASQINPNQFIDSSTPVLLKNILVQSTASLTNETNSWKIGLDISGDSILLDTMAIAGISIDARYTPENTTVKFHSNSQEVELNLNNPADLFDFNQLEYEGVLSCRLPRPTDLAVTAGSLYTRFTGRHESSDLLQSFEYTFDTIRYVPEGSDLIYRTSGMLSVQQEDEFEMSVKLASSELHLLAAPDFFDWIKKPTFLQYPSAKIEGRLFFDSTIVNSLTGVVGSLEMEKLSAEADPKDLRIKGLINALRYEDFIVEDLQASYTKLQHQRDGELKIASVRNPYLPLEEINLGITTGADSVVTLTFSSFLPEVQQTIRFGLDMLPHENGVLMKMNDQQELVLGSQTWRSLDEDGIFFTTKLDSMHSDVELVNGDQKIKLVASGNRIDVAIDSLLINPLADIVLDSVKLYGTLNLNANWNSTTSEINGKGSIQNLQLDTISLGTLSMEANSTGGFLDAKLGLTNNSMLFDLRLRKQKGPLNYELMLRDFDLGMLNAYLTETSNDLQLSGMVDGAMKGTYDDGLTTNGYVTFRGTKLQLPQYGFLVQAEDQTIGIKNNFVSLNQFSMKDKSGNALTLDGNVTLDKDPEFNLRLLGENYTLLDQPDDSFPVAGLIQVDTDIKITGKLFQELDVTGYFNSKPNADLRYKYKSEVTLDDREEEVNFVSFSKEEKVVTKPAKAPPAFSVDWNVDVSIGDIELYILIAETSSDYARMMASGKIHLGKGAGGEPLLFGDITSTDGSIYYEAPMISNLDLKILSASAEWNGPMDNPSISFRGTEVFRLTPNEVSSQFTDTRSRVPVSVQAIVEDKPIEDFNISFDLSSSNGEIQRYFESLPPETRETYAINLLVFGRINSGAESGGSSIMGGVVSKLNEISRRNIKNAELSFYVDSNSNPNATGGEDVDNFGYSFSKGLFNKKVRLSVGGDINLSSNAPQGSQKFNPLGNLSVEYVISESPEVTISASRNNSYKGAVDGQVDEASLGLNYKKKFRNFFMIFRKKEDK